MQIFNRQCSPHVLLLALLLVGGGLYYKVYKVGTSRGLAASHIHDLERAMSSGRKHKGESLEDVIDRYNEKTGGKSAEKLSVLLQKNKELKKIEKELNKNMDLDNKKLVAHVKILKMYEARIQKKLDGAQFWSDKDMKGDKKAVKELKDQVRLVHNQLSNTKRAEPIAEVNELDEETLKWKKLLKIDIANKSLDFVNLTKVGEKDLEHFKRWSLSQENLDFLFRAFDIFLEIAEEEKIPYFISEGTLLGSYRHHGLIPWDGDIDVIMDNTFKEKFLEAFKRKNYTDYVVNQWRPWLKIHPVNGSKPIRGFPWKTPFVDVFYYNKNSTHVWGKGYLAKRPQDVFPLTKRPFQGRMVKSPRDPRRVLVHSFPRDFNTGPSGAFEAERVCKGAYYDYIKERMLTKRVIPVVPCTQLFHLYPFVRHVRGEGGAYCKEELVLNGKVISEFYRSSEGIPVC